MPNPVAIVTGVGPGTGVPNAADEFFIKPAAIAVEVWHVAHQDRSAWSFNVELSPCRETW